MHAEHQDQITAVFKLCERLQALNTQISVIRNVQVESIAKLFGRVHIFQGAWYFGMPQVWPIIAKIGTHLPGYLQSKKHYGLQAGDTGIQNRLNYPQVGDGHKETDWGIETNNICSDVALAAEKAQKDLEEQNFVFANQHEDMQAARKWWQYLLEDKKTMQSERASIKQM